MKTSLYKECKRKNGLDVCSYNYGLMNTIDQLAGFLNCWYPKKYKDIIQESSILYDRYQEDSEYTEDFYTVYEELERIVFNVKIKGYYLVENNGYLFFVDSVTYKKEFSE